MITNEQCEAFIETFRTNEWRGELEAIRLGLEAATRLEQVTCSDHRLVQHRDGKPPWCSTCGRATVPDAATELERARNLVNLREFEIDILDELITELKAERDAAVAAIERVRAIVSDPCSERCCDFCEGKNEGWEMVLEALDGAPEPEWEYGVVGVHGQVINNGDYEVEQTHRRRKAGPWLPVEGESNDA